MSGARQVFLGFFMALLSSAIVLGSLSLSLLEGGYVLAQVTTPGAGEMVFSGELVYKPAEGEPEGNAPEVPQEGLVILTPASNICPYPQNWIKITVKPDYTLRNLAHLYDTSVALLQAGNCMKGQSLVIGSELYVPPAPPRTPTPVIPTYRPPVYWTPVPTYPRWPTPTRGFPTSTPVTPPTQPPTPLPTAQPTPPTPLPTAPPTQPLPTQPPPTNPPPTSPPPTQPPPTEPPPTEAQPPTPVPPTPVPPTPVPQPTSQPPPQPTAQQPPPQPTLPPPPEPTSLPQPQATPSAPSQPSPQ